MARIDPLMPANNFKTTYLKQMPSPLFVRYDPVFDALMILLVSPELETVVHYVDEHVGLLYIPETLEIVGLQVEAFERKFLPAHVEVQRVWRLSDACDLEDAGDLILAVERQTPLVAREVAKAAESMLGQSGKAFTKAVEQAHA